MLLPFRKLLISGLALGAVVILATVLILQADEPSPESEKPTAEEPKVEAPNPFAVPDGKPEALLAFIESLRGLQPSEPGYEAVREFHRKRAKAINEAAGKILAAEPTESELFNAVDWKITALLVLQDLGDADAAEKLQAFPLVLARAGHKKLAREVMGFLLDDRLRRAMTAGPEKLEQLVGDIKKFIGEGPVGRSEVGLIMGVTEVLEYIDDTDLAADAYRSFGKVLSGSEIPELVAIGAKMNGAARRVGLIGKPMPLEGKFLDGTPLDWAAYSDKAVLVQFWATWCGPCREEIPNILRNWDLYHDRGFEVVGVNCDDERSQLEGFLKENKLPWKHLFSDDPNAIGMDNPMATHYGVMGIPALILIGPDGKVVSLAARGPKLGEHLDKLLGPVSEATTVEPEAAGVQ